MTTRDQIRTLENVGQGAAAWLLNLNARRLRERSDIPRAGDGTYNARELLAWSKRNLTAGEFKAAMESASPERLVEFAELLAARIRTVLPTLPSRP